MDDGLKIGVDGCCWLVLADCLLVCEVRSMVDGFLVWSVGMEGMGNK
jgi:hypothetical protein